MKDKKQLPRSVESYAALVLVFLAASVSAENIPAPSAPEYDDDGNYTVTYPWDYPSQSCDYFELQEKPATADNWLRVPDSNYDGIVEVVDQHVGIYEYRTLAVCEDYYGEQSWEETSGSVSVQVGPTPTHDSLSTQLDYEFETRVGDLNSDGLQDIYLNRISAADEGNGSLGSIVMLGQPDGDFVASAASVGQAESMSNWPMSEIDLLVVDANLDGFADVLMPQLGESIPGAMDQIVYAPAELYEYEPLGSAAIDDNVTEFLDQFRAWVDDPSYFQDNAIWVEDPGHWDYEVECDWYYWGDFPEIECTTVPVWVDGDEYWSYAHMNQSAVQLAEALGWENPVFPSAISLEGGNIIEQVFGQIFGVGVFGGVLSGGGIGGWEIEIGLDGDDRGIAFSILIYDIAEETEPRDWRPYSIGEAVFLSANGFDIPRIHRVKIFRKEYGPAKFAGFQNQVIAPNGNIYIPDGNWSFRANLPWSEDYMLEDDWALMTFLHESFHVYQKRAKYRAPGVFWIKAINRDYGYDIEEGKDFWDYSLEQQATIIMERWYLGVTGQRTGYDNTVTMDELNAVIPFTCIVCQ